MLYNTNTGIVQGTCMLLSIYNERFMEGSTTSQHEIMNYNKST